MRTPLKAVVFDLDGTLIDSIQEIAQAANAALRSEGFSGHEVAAYRAFIGDGVERLLERALPVGSADPVLLTRLADRVRATYQSAEQSPTKPFQGIPPALDQLMKAGLCLAVLSNKPHAATQRAVAVHFGRELFFPVFGASAATPLKPDPLGALAISEKLGCDASECALVGDSASDIETAHAAGMTAIGVSWGYRDAAELAKAGAQAICDHPRELVDALLRLSQT